MAKFDLNGAQISRMNCVQLREAKVVHEPEPILYVLVNLRNQWKK